MTFKAGSTKAIEWRTRPLCCRYLLLHFDSQSVQVLADGRMRNLSVHLPLGVVADGLSELVGVWLEPFSGPTNWQEVFEDLKARGVERIHFVASSEPIAVHPAFQGATMPPSVGRLLRESLAQVAPRDRASVAQALNALHNAATERAARAAIANLSASRWAARYPDLIDHWQSLLPKLAPYFGLPPRLRRIVLWADDAAQLIQEQLVRAVNRHGPFDDRDAAISFLDEVLSRVE